MRLRAEYIILYTFNYITKCGTSGQIKTMQQQRNVLRRRWPSFETALSERPVIAGLRAYTAPYFRPL